MRFVARTRNYELPLPPADLRRLEHHRQSCFGNDYGPRTAVIQNVGIVIDRPHGVDRHRDDARLDRSEETGGKVNAVVETEQHTLLRLDAETQKRVRAAVRALAQLGVRVRAALVKDGDPAGALTRKIALQQIDSCVVVGELHNFDLRMVRAFVGFLHKPHVEPLRRGATSVTALTHLLVRQAGRSYLLGSAALLPISVSVAAEPCNATR